MDSITLAMDNIGLLIRFTIRENLLIIGSALLYVIFFRCTIEALRGLLRVISQEERREEWRLETEWGSARARQFRHDFLHMSFKDHPSVSGAINQVGTSFQRGQFKG